MIRKLIRNTVVVIGLLTSINACAQPAAVAQQGPVYYNVVGLGSSEGDSTFWYPYPMAVLEIKDTANYSLRLRFPYLGVLGNEEDTLSHPTHFLDSLTFGYRSSKPLMHFSVPATPYVIMAETIERATGKVLEIRPLPYRMNVERFASTRIDRTNEPQTDLVNDLMRRQFAPSLLPLTLEVNPGWRSREQFDTSGTYSLTFMHPTTNEIKLTVTVRSATISDIDSASWEEFKAMARTTFGDRGIAVNSVGDFVVDDTRSRAVIKAGYEMLTKREDGGMDYIAAYLTPKAVLLLMAPLSQAAPSPEYDYVRAIARSFRIK